MFGACAHGLGRLREAVALYDHVLQKNAEHSALYLREMALRARRTLDVRLKGFSLDNAVEPGVCACVFL